MIGYCDYGLVLNALENGQIDLMAGTPMLAQPGLIASHAFFTNRHVEVRSKIGILPNVHIQKPWLL